VKITKNFKEKNMKPQASIQFRNSPPHAPSPSTPWREHLSSKDILAGFFWGILTGLGVAVVGVLVLLIFRVPKSSAIATTLWMGIQVLSNLVSYLTAGYIIARRTHPHAIINVIAFWVDLSLLQIILLIVSAVAHHPNVVNRGASLTSIIEIPGTLVGVWLYHRRHAA
jgi:hypothetical protein